MKHLNIIILVTTLLVISVIILRDNLSTSKQSEPKVSQWEGIDTESVAGSLIDSCRCTVIEGKVYNVKVYQKQYFTYSQR